MTTLTVDTAKSAIALRRRPDDVLGIKSGPSSRGSTFWTRVLSCPRYHFFANELHWEPQQLTEPLTVGLIWHWCLEAYYRAIEAHQAACKLGPWQSCGRTDAFFFGGIAEAQKAAFEQLKPFASEPGYKDIYELIERMLDAYFQRYRLDRWEILAVEPTLYSAFRKGFEYSGRLDLVIIDWENAQHPLLRIVEHKSSASLSGMLGELITEGYTQDLQTLGQVWLAVNELDLTQYPPFVGSIVNIVSKGKYPACERVRVQPTKETLDNWERSMRVWQALLPMWREIDYPQNFASCTQRYGRCPYFEVCRSKPGMVPEDFRKLSAPTQGFRGHDE